MKTAQEAINEIVDQINSGQLPVLGNIVRIPYQGEAGVQEELIIVKQVQTWEEQGVKVEKTRWRQKVDIKLDQCDDFEYDGKPSSDLDDMYVLRCEVNGREATEDEVEFINDKFLGDLWDDIYQSLIP